MRTTTVCLLMISFIAACTSTTSEEMSSDTEYLVYISNKTGEGFDIYRNSITGDNEVRLTSDQGWEWRPQFVDETKMIVYNSEDTAGNFRMRAMNLSGNSLPFETFKLPEFIISTNRDWIAYTRKDSTETNIIIAKYASIIDSLQVTDNQKYNGRPNWSHERNLLAFISDRSGSNELYVYDLITNITKRITNNEMVEKYVSWSPDDSKLAVTMSTDGTNNDIYVVDLKTLSVEQITNSPINESEIAWSIKGNHIAYHAKVDNKDDIYVINLDTKNTSKVTDGKGYYGEPAWVMK